MRAGQVGAGSRQQPRVFFGWWIVLAYLVMNVYWAGTLIIGLTVFFAPIRHEFGWSAALLAAIFSLQSVAAGLVAPIVGVVFDRRGPRVLMVTATLLAGAGLLLLSRTNSLLSFSAAFIVLSLGFAIWSAGTGPALAALWFVRRRGTAMGLVVSGTALGGILVPFWNAVVETQGWRTAFLYAGGGVLLLTLPLCLLLRHRPEQYGLLPDGRSQSSPAPAAHGPATTFGDAMRTWQFWVVAGMGTVASLGYGAINVHILPSLREAAIPASLAVTAVTAMSLMGIAGRIGSGWLGDRLDPVKLVGATYGLQGIGLLLLAGLAGREAILPLAVIAFGFSNGGVLLAPSLLLVRYFGTPSFGRIQGVLLLSSTPGRVLGPVLTGAIHDQRHDYAPAYLLFGLLSLFACLPALRLRPPTTINR